MMLLTEHYTEKQTAAMEIFDELLVELEMISFEIKDSIEEVYTLSQEAAIHAMICFDERLEDNWQARKEDFLQRFTKFNFDNRLRYTINGKPDGKQISFDEFVGFNYMNENVNIQDYRNISLAYALLEPPYGLKLKIEATRGTPEYNEIKTKKYTEIYRMFLNDFILFSEYNKEDFVIYSWSDDWSNFFEPGREWWGNYYYTVYNKRNNTVIVLGASESD